eukprot:6967231-Pyramimonas_sp.AAC.1
MELKAQVEQGQDRDRLKYCRNAATRRASPLWAVPVELTWMIAEPAVNLGRSEQQSKKLEEQTVRAAEVRDDEEDMDKYRTLYKYRVG